jgi:D-3-phosphoglycerate dehydrogenase / 2-oxoglutarate reductase
VSHTVLVTDYAWPNLDVEQRILGDLDVDLLVADTGDEDELRELVPGADAILVNWKPLSGDVLRAAPRCRTVARYGVGLDNIDVATATELGMIVSNVPEFCTSEVADHTMALVLAHSRHVARFSVATASGAWDNRKFGPMRRLAGQVFGLVGYGRIARAVATRAVAFGYDVLAYSPSTAGHAAQDGIRFASDLTEVLVAADVLSLHLPASPATRHTIGRPQLAAMKPDALLVNTARGALIDQTALAEAIADGHLRGAALDVLDGEPPVGSEPLLTMDRVIVTPHASFDSLEAIDDLQHTAAHNVAAVLAGNVPPTIVNPEVLDSTTLRASVRAAP